MLIPTLDNDKHYWVGDDEVEKLLRRGAGWLAAHPERDLIAKRYLKYRRHLADDALAQLAGEETPDPDRVAEERASEEEAVDRRRARANPHRRGPSARGGALPWRRPKESTPAPKGPTPSCHRGLSLP